MHILLECLSSLNDLDVLIVLFAPTILELPQESVRDPWNDPAFPTCLLVVLFTYLTCLLGCMILLITSYG